MVNNSGSVAPQPLDAWQGRGWQIMAIRSMLLRYVHRSEESIEAPPGGVPGPANALIFGELPTPDAV
jgi:hypothetical protein